jgi:hypothetical protein
MARDLTYSDGAPRGTLRDLRARGRALACARDDTRSLSRRDLATPKTQPAVAQGYSGRALNAQFRTR